MEKFDADHLGFKGLKLSVLLYPSRLALLFAGYEQFCKFSVKNSEINLKLERFLRTSCFTLAESRRTNRTRNGQCKRTFKISMAVSSKIIIVYTHLHSSTAIL